MFSLKPSKGDTLREVRAVITPAAFDIGMLDIAITCIYSTEAGSVYAMGRNLHSRGVYGAMLEVAEVLENIEGIERVHVDFIGKWRVG